MYVTCLINSIYKMCIQSKVGNLYSSLKNGCGVCDDCLEFVIDTSVISTSTQARLAQH